MSSEGIVVYCTKGNVIFSSTGEIINTEKSVRKHKINRSVIFPVFEGIKKYETSSFWLNLMTRFSKNMLHKDFKFLNNVLYYKATTKKHRDEIFLDAEDLENTHIIFKEFMKKKGFLSQEEKESINKIVELDNNKERNMIETWKDVVKNQDYYIREFIIEMKEKHDLSFEEQSNLESNIRIGISSEFFNQDNIIFENEKINRIENLVWDKTERKFSINTEGIKLKKKSEKRDPNKIFTSYTIETSNDNMFMVYHELKDLSIEKKWNKFLEIIMNNKN
jgi:hypothetical protein|tara:strand:+ start:686 stop:1516 length:831 start_codon:yes stop_codon:yes gene_type:complete